MISAEQKNRAYVMPFVSFMGLMLLDWLAQVTGFKHDHPDMPWYRCHPEYVMMLLQCLVCLTMILYWKKCYEWNFSKGWILGIVVGLLGISLWILPTHLYTTLDLGGGSDPRWYKWLGLAPRDEGFDAKVFEGNTTLWWMAVIARFVRAVVVVALIEEIFWRGFLMRFLLKPDGNYWKVPFGVFHWRSYLVVTLAFTFVHDPVDWLSCIIFGSMMYWLAVKTKSLFACILAHGVANLAMGCYALSFGKFGLW